MKALLGPADSAIRRSEPRRPPPLPPPPPVPPEVVVVPPLAVDVVSLEAVPWSAVVDAPAGFGPFAVVVSSAPVVVAPAGVVPSFAVAPADVVPERVPVWPTATPAAPHMAAVAAAVATTPARARRTPWF